MIKMPADAAALDMSSAPAKSLPENIRERETFRYDDLGWTTAPFHDPQSPISPISLLSSPDQSLTAYAQLATHRLNATRSLVSLFDRNQQHVVAEATHRSPLAARKRLNKEGVQADAHGGYIGIARSVTRPKGDEQHDDAGKESFWLCGTAIPRSHGICEHVLLASVGAGASVLVPGRSVAGNEEPLPVSVIPDLATDARFRNWPYIHERPFNRFYAGIPIRTPGPDGVNIGVLCVFDTRPRAQGLSAGEVEFMQDMSKTVMGYLECRASSGRFRKSERMVRGMGSFVEGSSALTPRDGSSNRGSGHLKERPSGLVDLPEVPVDDKRHGDLPARTRRPESLSKTMGSAGLLVEDALLSPRTICTYPSAKDTLRPNTMGPYFDIGTSTRTAASRQPTTLAPDDSSRCSTPRPDSQHSGESMPQPAVFSQVSSADLQLAESSRVFAKAANIIRQSLEVDGVLFLDATVRSFGGLVGHQSDRKVSAVGVENLSYLSNDEDSASQTQSVSSKEDYCNVLGYSTLHAATINGDRSQWRFEGLRDRTLQRLLRRYPHGRIFTFEEDGTAIQTPLLTDHEPASPGSIPKRPVSPIRQWSRESRDSQDGEDYRSDGASEERRLPTIKKGRWNPAKSIIQMFPGARNVVLFPLWDGQKKRWTAGGFAWTKKPTHIFTTDGTLNFLRVFGLIVMAEIYRLNTKAEETIKSNILGSISHELRSPLHGLVGAVELLHDSRLDSVQQNVLHIIETSGKTLVDTINHLLDYSKINSFIENDKAEKRESVLGKVGAEPKDRSVQEKTRSQTLPVELDCLVEEVVESVLAGYSHEKMSGPRAIRDITEYTKPRDGSSTGGASTAQLDSSQERVQIILDIEPAATWQFHTHPGAFRRIVMNLFGNSLKFTRSGFIKISLHQEPIKSYRQSPSSMIVLTVADSGKGISEEYLRNDLFTPFCQEDHFAPGTGLGLSLVRQITVNLGGEVKVASQVGRGTTITVSLPLPYSDDSHGLGDSSGFGQNREMLSGRKVVLRGFNNLPWPQAHQPSSSSQDGGTLQEPWAHFLENTCRNWLQMEVLSEVDAAAKRPDFVLHHDSTLSFADAEKIAAQTPCPVLFVCEASVAARNFSHNLPDAANRIRTFEFFSPPLGPRKLAKGLVHLLGMWKVKQEQNNSMNQTTSVEVLSVTRGVAESGSDVGKGRVVSAHRAEVKSTKIGAVGDRTSVLTQTLELKESPLPTPPDEAKMRDPLSSPDSAVTERAVEVNAAATDRPMMEPAVLIVDDNQINLSILSAYMKKLNRPYVTAVNGLESSNKYISSPSDYCCILTDISMPIMDGLESARQIRQYERANRLKQTPIIALTGLAGTGVQEDAVASGIDMFLTRPVTLKRLVEALETVELGPS